MGRQGAIVLQFLNPHVKDNVVVNIQLMQTEQYFVANWLSFHALQGK